LPLELEQLHVELNSTVSSQHLYSTAPHNADDQKLDETWKRG